MKVSRKMERVPFTTLGYVMMLIGFALLGIFVATLANTSAWAILAGIGALAAFTAMSLCFWFRIYEIRHMPPRDGIRLSLDPLQPPRNREEVDQYLQEYRKVPQHQ